jgi:hypothetical protein
LVIAGTGDDHQPGRVARQLLSGGGGGEHCIERFDVLVLAEPAPKNLVHVGKGAGRGVGVVALSLAHRPRDLRPRRKRLKRVDRYQILGLVLM